MILTIDNYDSFTFNLVRLVEEIAPGEPHQVIRNDALTLDQAEALSPAIIILSPGPGGPDEAGLCVPLIREFAGRAAILGVCLGHQCIGRAFGARITRARSLMHGKTSKIQHKGEGLFENVPSPFDATRYHSLALARDRLPECFRVTAWTTDGEIMGIRHRRLPIHGTQFHPESFLTPAGRRIIGNFLRMAKRPVP